jgi:antirestriction protein ArdC
MSEPTRFVSLPEIVARYKRAKRRFYSKKRLYEICRDHCKYGGTWPRMTRDAKLALRKAAIACRHLQQLKQHLEAKAAAVTLD